MQPLTRVEGRAIPLGLKNVDTDIIIPAKWLKTISREGLGAGAFEALRAEPGNVIDDPAYAGATLLIAGEAGTILRSTDAGLTWGKVASPYEGSYFGIQPVSASEVVVYGMRGKLMRSEDAREGPLAFAQKRKPEWKAR